MVDSNYFWGLLTAALAVGIAGLILHQRAYDSLYRALRERGVVGAEYAPDLSARLGSLGCMGFLTQLKREVGFDRLRPEELSLARRASVAYYATVPVVFVATGILFWWSARSPV